MPTASCATATSAAPSSSRPRACASSGARLKYNPLPEVARGKRVVVLDDSIVRGTTQRQLVGMLREIGGAREVHVRITAPPVRWPCFLGIDIPDPDELIAQRALDVDEIRERIGADSLEYLSVENLAAAIGTEADRPLPGLLHADYPIDVQLPLRQARRSSDRSASRRRWSSRATEAVGPGLSGR